MQPTKRKPKAYKKMWEPTPEEIAEECRKIREENEAKMRDPQLFEDDTIRKPERHRRETCTPDAIGTGPPGETCQSCDHCQRVQWHNKAYYKCGKMREHWTHGGGSDIKLKWAACSCWKPQTSQEGTAVDPILK